MEKCLIKVTRGGIIGLLASSLMFCFAASAETLQFNDGATLIVPGADEEDVFPKDYRSSHIINGSKVYGHDFTAEVINQLTKDGIKVGKNSKNNFLNLQEGNILFSPDKNIVVGTQQGNLNINSGAAVFVIESTDGLVLYDLHQSRTKQVTVLINGEELFLVPGRMLVLSRDNKTDFEDLDLDCHAVAYGRTQKILIPDEGTNGKDLAIFVGEFSVSRAFLTIEPLKQLVASSNKQDQLVLEKILRGAAAARDFIAPIPPSQLANRTKQL